MFLHIFRIAIFLISSTTLPAQSNYTIRAFINPLGARIGNLDVEENGLGYFDVKTSRLHDFDLGTLLSIRVAGPFHVNIGAAYKYNKLNIQYRIADPLDDQIILVDGDRFIQKHIFSPHLGIEWRKANYFIGTGMEGNIDIDYKTNILDQEGPIYNFYDPVTMEQAFLYFNEIEIYHNDFIEYTSPYFNGGYMFLPGWYMTLNFKIKPYGNLPMYALLIEGKPLDLPHDNHILNSTQIRNRWIYASVGLAYDFTGKQKNSH